MQGLSFHGSFTPKGCGYSIDTHVVTAAAGSQFGKINDQASLRNLTVVGGGAETVGIGGYLTGGGHSALSATYGLAVDQVLEMEIVTPGGEILTVNECQNEDLFWAMRGGGGSTFGVLTSVTLKAFPSTPFATAKFFLSTPTASEAYWDVIAYILSQYPSLSTQGIAGYPIILPNFTNSALNITTPVAGFGGLFFIPLLSPSNTSASLTTTIANLFADATAPYPLQFEFSIIPEIYPDFYSWYKNHNGPLDAGYNILVGSRLLDVKALTANLTALKEAFKRFTPPGSISGPFLVSGKGVWDAVPRGGSNSVNPAWRTALVHSSESFLSTITRAPPQSPYLGGRWQRMKQDLGPGGNQPQLANTKTSH
ncbi:MAG: hypothetical protein M1839_003280 [Geoglossum umbratile]|nr:MAG: hypothetical protein M1839_003280 [Geoglossum umbratile]